MQQPEQSPIWYFAFGQPPKSSLLNQYCREHNIPYVKPHTPDELQKYINQQCIIQTYVSMLLEWQPRKCNISVIFLGEKFSQEQVKIRKEYMQIARCKSHPSFQNYEQFRKTMYPNLIFFYGPNKQHRQGAAATIGFQSLSTYISEFPKSANEIVTKYSKSQNYTFSWVFTDPRQIQVLLSRFSLKIVHFAYSRSDFPNDEQYFDQEYSIVDYLIKKPYFLSLNAKQLPHQLMDRIGEFLCPRLTFVNANNQDEKQYAMEYATAKKTELYSIFDIQGINKRKNIPLAVTLQQKIRRLNAVIYNDLWAEEIVLVDFPWHVNEVCTFEQINRKFSHFVDLDPPREYMYSSMYTSNIYFLQTQRRVQPSLEFPLIGQIEHTRRYWLVVGPQGAGKSTVAKFLQQQYGLTNIEFQPYLATLKEKLLTPEDGEQLPQKKVIAHFQQLLNQKLQQEYVIDGFSFADVKSWLSEIGTPTVINLKVDENELIKRQRKKAEADITAEVNEEQLQRARDLIAKQSQFLDQITSISPQTVIYTVDYTQPIILAEKLLQSIYQPRVFLVQSMPTLLYHNIAIRYNCCLINLAINSFEQAKTIAKQSGKRDILIVNYKNTQDKMVSEDLYWLEKNIGKVRYLAVWHGEEKTYNEEMIQLERPVQEKKIKKIVEGQESEEQPPEQQPVQEQGQPKKKKLDIYAYEWTKPLSSKNLSQWYFKLKKNMQQYETAPKEAYKAFRTRLEIINNSPNVNLYEVIKPTQVQL